MNTITPAQKLGFAIVAAICAMVSTAMCIGCDSFNEASAPMSSIYWAFVLAGAAPVSFGLWILRKPTAWFFFGMWLGVLTLLPWIPWFGGKRFFNAVHELHTGMSLPEVRVLMKEFIEEEGAYNGQSEKKGMKQLNYGWDPSGMNGMDNVTLTFSQDRVVDIYISTE